MVACSTNPTPNSLGGLLDFLRCTLIDGVIPLLFAIAIAAFVWGIIQFFLNPENEEKRKKGKSFMIGGLIALFVMTSMWGIIRIFSKTFDVETVIPTLDTNPTN